MSAATYECIGICISAAEVGVGSIHQIAYAHPDCPLHEDGEGRAEADLYADWNLYGPGTGGVRVWNAQAANA